MGIAHRVAKRYLAAAAEDTLLATAGKNIQAVQQYKDQLAGYAATLQALIAAGEARRLGRISGVAVGYMKFDGNRISTESLGSKGSSYQTHITLNPRGHHCTCPDWKKMGRKVGPCKHVLNLGKTWLDQVLIPEIKDLNKGLVGILEKTNL